MTKYVVSRLLLIIPTLGLLSVGLFAIIRLLPGDVVDIMYEENGYAATKAEMREILGLNDPIAVQYVHWVGDVATGDFGTSLLTKRTIGSEIKQRMPVTLELGLSSFVLAMLIAFPIGVLSAIKQDSLIDYAVRSYAVGGLSIPNFWLATLIIIFGAKWFGWSPPVEFITLRDDPVGHVKQLIVPALVLGGFGWSSVIRMTRAMMLEVLREDYIRTARAKGLANSTVILRHALRNAIIPVITIIGNFLPGVLSGAVIIEVIFGLPGIGRYAVEAIRTRDYPMLQAINLFFALQVVGMNLIVDLAYGAIDPRIRYGNA
jgi:peptide/nickel transport system permease protein